MTDRVRPGCHGSLTLTRPRLAGAPTVILDSRAGNPRRADGADGRGLGERSGLGPHLAGACEVDRFLRKGEAMFAEPQTAFGGRSPWAVAAVYHKDAGAPR
jgi:hypothetical protein